jgi:phage terminase large subunit-like protein
LSNKGWEAKLKAGKSLIPDLPLYRVGDRAVAVFNKLRLADVPGTPYLAEAAGDWFREIVRVVFGSCDPVTQVRAIREFFLLVPKKNWKTGGGALIMLTALLLNRRPNAPLFFVAPVHETAEMAFSAAAGAIALDEVLSKKLHVRDHLKKIVHRESGAELSIVTFDPATLTGKKCAAVLVDELHVVSKMSKAPSAIRQLRGGMIPFGEAFMMFITTQSEEAPSGVFKSELLKARGIRDGKMKGATLPILYEWPRDMQKDQDVWRDHKNWKMITPNDGRSVTVARLIEEFDVAQSTGDDELRAWASQHLNVEIGVALHSDRWAGADFWEARGDQTLTLDELIRRCEVITAGVDFGGMDDWLALSFTGREKITGRWLHWAHAWAHPIAFVRRKSEAERWKDFVGDGDLTVVEQVGDEVSAVIAIIMKCEKSGLLERIGVDRYKIQEIFDGLIKEGLAEDRIVAIDQGWKLVGAISTTERRLASGKFVHGGSAMMAYCVGNAKVETKGNNIVISKQIAGASKIDPLMATFNAVSLLALNPEAAKKKFQFFAIG